jgi:hypothetical protein
LAPPPAPRARIDARREAQQQRERDHPYADKDDHPVVMSLALKK